MTTTKTATLWAFRNQDDDLVCLIAACDQTDAVDLVVQTTGVSEPEDLQLRVAEATDDEWQRFMSDEDGSDRRRVYRELVRCLVRGERLPLIVAWWET